MNGAKVKDGPLYYQIEMSDDELRLLCSELAKGEFEGKDDPTFRLYEQLHDLFNHGEVSN